MTISIAGLTIEQNGNGLYSMGGMKKHQPDKWFQLQSIEDDAGGEFVTVEQPGLADAGKIRIDPTEWTALRAAIDRMIGECRALQAAI